MRPVVSDDADEILAAHRDSRAYHHPWATPFTDRAGFESWLADIAAGSRVGLVARDAQTGGIVGVVNLNQIFRLDFQNAMLGYNGMVAFAGRGLMTEAVRLAVRHAFHDLGLHRLEANVQPGNLRSIALVRRLGFRFEGLSPRYLRIGGVWCDHERWALLADEAGSVPIQQR